MKIVLHVLVDSRFASELLINLLEYLIKNCLLFFFSGGSVGGGIDFFVPGSLSSIMVGKSFIVMWGLPDLDPHYIISCLYILTPLPFFLKLGQGRKGNRKLQVGKIALK